MRRQRDNFHCQLFVGRFLYLQSIVRCSIKYSSKGCIRYDRLVGLWYLVRGGVHALYTATGNGHLCWKSTDPKHQHS